MQALSRPQKILAVMFELCHGDATALQYEDIVVAVFKRYPEDFQLRGYPQYPDSSDVHKPLYEMKQQGLIRSANKTFELTPRGLEVASSLVHSARESKDRLTCPCCAATSAPNEEYRFMVSIYIVRVGYAL